MSFYNLSANTPSGKELKMDIHKGKLILVVNTATKCGLTPQFNGLEKLHQKFKDKGLVVLGFPCNQFLSQEPLNNENMVETCLINHGVTFQLFEKINVNGKDTHPIYKYLKKSIRYGLFSSRIKWNFEKFIINKDGRPGKRLSPKAKPKDMESLIIKLLGV